MSEPDRTARVSILITTRNRKEELMRALRSVFAQDVSPIEVLVLDDGSTDGTAEAVASEFPDVRVERSEESVGLIRQRNRGAELAAAPIIGFLDDDCELSSPRVLSAGLAGFDHPRVGAVALPMEEFGVARSGIFNRAPDDEDGVYVTDTYAGGASLLRREAFLWLGGYRSEVRRGEDSDHARRMLQHGLVVRVVRAPEIRHYVSTARVRADDVFWQARTNVLATTLTLPYRTLPRRVALSFGHGVRHREPGAAIRGIASGLLASWTQRSRRNPVKPPLARALRRMESERLRRRHAKRLEDLERHLPPLVEFDLDSRLQ